MANAYVPRGRQTNRRITRQVAQPDVDSAAQRKISVPNPPAGAPSAVPDAAALAAGDDERPGREGGAMEQRSIAVDEKHRVAASPVLAAEIDEPGDGLRISGTGEPLYLQVLAEFCLHLVDVHFSPSDMLP